MPTELPPPPAPTIITEKNLQAFGTDLASMLSQEGVNFEDCIRDAVACNLGIEVERPPPDTCCMFKEVEQGKPELAAHMQTNEHSAA